VEVLTEVEPEALQRMLAEDRFFWLDLVEPTPLDLEVLGNLLDLHPAAVEDTIEWGQIPKLDDYGEHVVLVFFTARVAGERLDPVEVHVYVAGEFILTFRTCETPLDGLREWLTEADPESEDEALYHVLNALADGWDPVIEELDRRVDEVERDVLARPKQEHLGSIYRLKQDTNGLSRIAVPQRDLLPAAIETMQAVPGLTRGSKQWLRDVTTHMDSVSTDLSRSIDDLLALTSTFFNASAYRLNRLATLIAVGSIVFLVWTLVTSFFGQNFRWLVDHVDSKSDFLVYGVGGLVVPTVLIGAVLYWRRRDWL
jgi:magnesium transporter